MVADLVAMPVSPADLLRVNKFYPFEEGARRLLFVVENAAFAEADPAAWRLAELLAGSARVQRSEIVRALASEFTDEEVLATFDAFARLEILEPYGRPKMRADLEVVPAPPLSSLVLHVAHDCNLRCGYCYADYGRYGDDFGMLSEEMAIAHCARFFDQLGPTKNVHVTFFGGEPLLNIPVVMAAHAYLVARAKAEGKKIAFGLTTNGTLLTEELVDFFAREKFTITVSIDGPPDINDRLRPLQDGGGSYERIMERVRATGIRAIARVTLTRRSTDIARIVRHLIEAGFREVGVSPVATGNDKFDLGLPEFEKVLEGMRTLADDFVAWAKMGRVLPFSNLKGLLEQIAAGDPRPLPCGAGTKLAAADNKGDWYACHRLVGEEAFKIGDLTGGVDVERRFALLKSMHPQDRAPCGECWARYLCGGGCHHIAWLHSSKGEAPWAIADGFCDFLRSWYRLGLYTYARLLDEAPEVLTKLRGEKTPCSQPSGL